MSKRSKLPLFTPMYVGTQDSPAWRCLTPGSRALYLLLKKQYHRKNQTAVYLSTRIAAKELGVDTKTVMHWFRELRHYGFIVKVKETLLGEDGQCPHYRLADERYLGQQPSLEFTFWNGLPFEREPEKSVGETPTHRRRKRNKPVGETPTVFQTDSRKPIKARFWQKRP